MSVNFVLPRRSAPVWIISALVSLLRWTILAATLLLLAPYVLAFFENPRGHLMTNLALRYQEQFVQLAAPRLHQYVPTRIAGKDRADWILIAGLGAVAFGAGSLRDRLVRRATARQIKGQIKHWKESMQIRAESHAAAVLEAGFKPFENAKSVDRSELLRA